MYLCISSRFLLPMKSREVGNVVASKRVCYEYCSRRGRVYLDCFGGLYEIGKVHEAYVSNYHFEDFQGEKSKIHPRVSRVGAMERLRVNK
jgi:hypothetical protein